MREADFQLAIKSVHAGVPHVRFPIYRNNVASGLVTALAVRFPVTQELVGQEFFRAMAALYVEDNKPISAVLIYYGETLADFIAGFEPAKTFPYLGDVARLENLWWRAYHAADATVVGAHVLGSFPQDALGDLRFTLHSSVGVMSSRFAIGEIWHAHHGGDAMGTFDLGASDHILVSRPAANVEVRTVTKGFSALTAALKGGAKLINAVEVAAEADSAFELASALGQLFELNLICGVSHD